MGELATTAALVGFLVAIPAAETTSRARKIQAVDAIHQNHLATKHATILTDAIIRVSKTRTVLQMAAASATKQNRHGQQAVATAMQIVRAAEWTTAVAVPDLIAGAEPCAALHFPPMLRGPSQ
jgi:hypothetical protein